VVGVRGGGDFDHFETELAFGDFLERDVHESELWVKRDKGAEALAKLADALGNDVNENLGTVHNLEGILDERLFHKNITKVTEPNSCQVEKFDSGPQAGTNQAIFGDFFRGKPKGGGDQI
jgi:hypothetical protein